MSSGDELLAQLAERPFDRALRLVFSDWLLEQGDPRGEVIALWARGNLTLTQKRRVQRLVEQHAAAWLGPLVTVADVAACRWDGGFLDTFAVGGPPESAWRDVVGDRGLASVRNLVFPVMREPRPAVPFLLHPVLRHVERLQLGAELLEALGNAPLAFSPRALALASWGTFARELSTLARLETMKGARRLELITSEFINPIVAGEVRRVVLSHARALERFDELRLVARYGVLEGSVAWLLRGADARRVEVELPGLRRWGADYHEVHFTLERDSDSARYASLTVDLSGGVEPEYAVPERVAAAAAVVGQLAPAELSRVAVTQPPGSGLKRDEKDALRAAVRRLRTVVDFTLGSAPALP